MKFTSIVEIKDICFDKNPPNNTNSKERYAEYIKQRERSVFLCRQRVKEMQEHPPPTVIFDFETKQDMLLVPQQKPYKKKHTHYKPRKQTTRATRTICS